MLGMGSVKNVVRGRTLLFLSSAGLATLAVALVAAMPADAGKRHHRKHKAAAPTKSKIFTISPSSPVVDEGSGPLAFTVTRSPSHGPASVHVATSDGTALAGTDYSSLSTTLSFKSGQASQNVSVTILDDHAAGEDPTATFSVGLDSASKGYTVGTPASVTINEDAPPSAPANLHVTGSDPYDVNLGWDASAGATGYTVYRSTTSGSGYSSIGTTTGTGFIDSGVASGSTYYYVVQASGDDGNSGNSSETNATPPGGNLLSNGGFETGDFTGWTTGTGNCVNACRVAPPVPAPSIDSGTVLSGSYSAFLGQPTSCFPNEDSGQAFFYQSVAVPATGTTTLTWYYNGQSDDNSNGQQVYITNSTGATVLATVQSVSDNSRTWTRGTYDLSSLAGSTVRVYFRVFENGDQIRSCTGMNVDNVSVING